MSKSSWKELLPYFYYLKYKEDYSYQLYAYRQLLINVRMYLSVTYNSRFFDLNSNLVEPIN